MKVRWRYTELWRYFHKPWVSELINYGGDCRTAPATPGLLISWSPGRPKTNIFCNHVKWTLGGITLTVLSYLLSKTKSYCDTNGIASFYIMNCYYILRTSYIDKPYNVCFFCLWFSWKTFLLSSQDTKVSMTLLWWWGSRMENNGEKSINNNIALSPGWHLIIVMFGLQPFSSHINYVLVSYHNCFNPMPMLQLLGELPIFSENIPRTKVISWS